MRGDENNPVSIVEAMFDNDHEKVLRLIAAGADVNELHGGFRPLTKAALEGWLDIVEALLDKGADINACDSSGWSVLACAAYGGYEDICSKLFASGAGVDDRNVEGITPLMQVARGSNASAVRFLLEHGANIDAQSCKGLTALFRAAAGGMRDTVAILLENNADMYICSNAGVNPRDAAKQMGHFDVAEMIEEAMRVKAIREAAEKGTIKPRRILRRGVGVNKPT
ncbi:MAG: ankyrin repeat domain-containing protein [Alphaproteobacteria bacterium]|nr:ankyrin repeat domain-containing protein [Alphaproteobacteria bacterium]